MYKITLETVKLQIPQAENPTPTEVISTDGVRVDNDILRDSLTSVELLEDLEIGITDPNIPIANNCMHDKLHFGIPAGCEDYR
jgi:hypothetical protein